MARFDTPGATTGRRGRRNSSCALVIAIICGFSLLGLASCTVVSAGAPTAPLLNINAPVPSGSALYSLRYVQDNGGSYHTIVRVDAVTGKQQWQQALQGDITQIAVSDGMIYADNGVEALALRGSDGTRIWSVTHSALGQTQSTTRVPLGELPVVADGHVYIVLGRDSGSFQPVQVVALRARDGARLWSRASSSAGVYAAGDGLVVVASAENGIVALHAADGSLAWRWQAPDNNTSRDATLLGGLVYVDESPAPLIALDERTGALVWTLPCWKETGIASSASGARIYIGCLEPHNPYAATEGVYAFDTQQRQLLWKYHAINLRVAPVAVSNLVYIAAGTALDAVRASDGKLVWSQQAEEPNAGPVALALIGDTLYVRVSVIYPHVPILDCCKRSYSLSALRPSDGAAYWRVYEPNEALWPIVT
jgi:outer membrane protein assembly factor BamB